MLKQYEHSLEFNKKKFKCMDRSDIELYGNYNSDSAKLLSFRVERCQNFTAAGVPCAEESEIDQYLKDKFMLVIYNQKIFNVTEYHEEARKFVAKMAWIKISTRLPQQIPFEMQLTGTIQQDYDIGLDDVTLRAMYELYLFERMDALPWELDDFTQLIVTFEVNPHMSEIFREIYQIFDFFSDVGGLQGLLFSWIAVFLGMLNY